MDEASPAATSAPKQRLLAAVVTVALTEGISDKSLRAIAEAAGTSHRMLIHHFGSREGLLVDVIREVEERQRTVLAEMVADPAIPASPAILMRSRRPGRCACGSTCAARN